jgi:hypothetical protein
MRPGCQSLPRTGFSLGVIALLLLAAVPAFAEQRLVRVLWDVGRKVVYVQVNDRTKAGHDGFSVPANEDAAHTAGFNKYEDYSVLKQGDRVRLYVVNYNPVAHVWHDSSVAEQIAPEPSLLAAILKATVTGITGGLETPAFSMSLKVGVAATRSADPADACTSLHQPFRELVQAASTLDQAAVTIDGLAAELKLNTDATTVAEFPTRSDSWNTFDNKAAWDLIRDFAVKFPAKYSQLVNQLDEADAAVLDANIKLIAFDRESTAISGNSPTAPCLAEFAKNRDSVQAFMRGVTAADSSLSQISTKYSSTKKLLDGYEKRLTSLDWAADAVEVIVADPVVEDGALRLDAVFVSPDALFTPRIQRSLVLKVETHFPALTISSGVARHGLAFKTLGVTQGKAIAADGTVSAKARIGIVDDPNWDEFVPVWIQNVRIFGRGFVGLYGSFGTTPDRNIFNNAILGVSLVVPHWRTSFTVGGITARGYQEDDLKAAMAEFSDGEGFAISGADVATLAKTEPKWKKAWYYSVTFMLASF